MLSEAAHRLYVQVRGQSCVFASANDDQPDRHCARPSGVHFLRFQFTRTACVQLLAGAAAAIGCAHPGYPWRVLVPAAPLAPLAEAPAPRPGVAEAPAAGLAGAIARGSAARIPAGSMSTNRR